MTKTTVSAPVMARMTTIYVPSQDRVCLSGQIGDDKVTVIWMTQRLCNRLVKTLTKWLEELDKAAPRNDLLQSVKQQRARAQHEQRSRAGEDPPVSAEQPDSEWLLISVDIQQRPDRVQMIFKDDNDAPQHTAAMVLQPAPLRQWLNILLIAYQRGDWSMQNWPEWMLEQVMPSMPPDTAVH